MQSYIKHKRYYDKKAKASYLKERGYCNKLITKGQKYRSVTSVGLDPIWYKKSYQIITTLCKSSTQTNSHYTESASESTNLKNLLKTIIWKLNGRLAVILSFHKMIYTPLHRKRKLVDTFLIFLS